MWILTFILVLLTTPSLAIKGGNHLTISGLSSGGYLTSIITTAFSSEISGSANIAGGAYYCSEGDMMTAFTQ